MFYYIFFLFPLQYINIKIYSLIFGKILLCLVSFFLTKLISNNVTFLFVLFLLSNKILLVIDILLKLSSILLSFIVLLKFFKSSCIDLFILFFFIFSIILDKNKLKNILYFSLLLFKLS